MTTHLQPQLSPDGVFLGPSRVNGVFSGLSRRCVRSMALVLIVVTACARDVEQSISDSGSPPRSATSTSSNETSTTGYFGETISMEDRIRLVVECVKERGFPAEFVPPDGVHHLAPPDQQDASLEAGEQCLAEVDRRYPRTPAPSREQEFRAQLTVAECLRKLGYDIPQAPTFDAWVESFADPEQDPWLPYAFLPPMNLQDWIKVDSACPQPVY